MQMSKTWVFILSVTFLSFLIGIYVYPMMPDEMVSHWDVHGQVDGYMPKVWGLFLIPFILVGLELFFVVIPRVDPLRVNIEKFRRYYDGFVVLLVLFLFFVYLMMILWNMGLKISPNVVFPVGFGILFFYAGVLCENAKRNWFIGIRTPWTLSSEKVWDKTHKVGGRLFKITGVVVLTGVFFPGYTLFFILVPLVLVGVYVVVYSYFEFQKEMKQKT